MHASQAHTVATRIGDRIGDEVVGNMVTSKRPLEAQNQIAVYPLTLSAMLCWGTFIYFGGSPRHRLQKFGGLVLSQEDPSTPIH
jgi:hypothetical protein